MKTTKLGNDLHIIWAIAAKDITDAIRNKVIWQAALSIGLIMALYKALPVIAAASMPPHMTVYDAGESILTIHLENSANVETRTVSSRQDMALFVAMEGSPELGLAIPADFDRALESGKPLRLDGYLQHWVSDARAEALERQAEQEISSLLAQPVDIDLEGHRVYPRLDGFGPYTWAATSIAMVLAIVGLNVTPQLMIEEKQAKTIDALLTSPAGSGQIVAGKALAGFVYCLVGIAVVLGFHAAMVTRWDLAIVAVICGTVLAVALGLLLGMLLETRQSLKLWELGLTLFFIMPVVLSGMAIDLPARINAVVRWLPPAALGRLLVVSMSDSAPLAEIAIDLALTLLPAGVILAIVAWQINRANR